MPPASLARDRSVGFTAVPDQKLKLTTIALPGAAVTQRAPVGQESPRSAITPYCEHPEPCRAMVAIRTWKPVVIRPVVVWDSSYSRRHSQLTQSGQLQVGGGQVDSITRVGRNCCSIAVDLVTSAARIQRRYRQQGLQASRIYSRPA